MSFMTDSDKKQLQFFKKYIPEVLELPEINKKWHKYKSKSTLENKSLVFKSYYEMKKLVNIFVKFLHNEYKDFTFEKPKKRKKLDYEIVMYWHQTSDVDKLPECVKRCYKSFLKNQHRKIKLLCFEDVKKLIKLDAGILSLFEQGKIQIPLLSDYIRVLLLENYNVMWVDATIFCIDEIPDEYFKQDFWSIKGNYMTNEAFNVKALTYNCHFGQMYLLGGSKNRIFSYARQMFEYYFNKYDTPYSYFIAYTFMEYLYRYDETIQKQIKALKVNNTHVEYITCQRDKSVTKQLLTHVLSKDTIFYKLSTRVDYNYDNNTFLAKFVKMFE